MTELTLPLTNITHWNAYGEIFTLEFFLWKNHAEFFAKIASLRLYCFNCSSTHTLNTIGGNWKPRGIRQIIFPLANATQLPLTVSEGKENTQAEKHEGNFLLCAFSLFCLRFMLFLLLRTSFWLGFFFLSFFYFMFFPYFDHLGLHFAQHRGKNTFCALQYVEVMRNIQLHAPCPKPRLLLFHRWIQNKAVQAKTKKKKPKTCKNKKVYMKKMKSVEETSWPTAPNCTYFLLKLVKLGENRLHTYKNELWAFFIV